MKHLIALLFVAQATLFIPSAIAERLLVDDFSIPQQGIETDQNIAYDLLEDPRLFGGGREIWGGGDSSLNCISETMSVKVAGGIMATTVSNECSGAGVVTWPARNSASSLDLSGYSTIQIDVAEIAGEIDTRITFDSNVSGNGRLNILLNNTGLHIFAIPESIELSSIRRLTIASLVGQDEVLSIDAVWLVVPESTAISLILIGLTFFSAIRRYG